MVREQAVTEAPEIFRGPGDPLEGKTRTSSVLEVLLRQTLRCRWQQLPEIEIGLSQSIRLADLNVFSNERQDVGAPAVAIFLAAANVFRKQAAVFSLI